MRELLKLVRHFMTPDAHDGDPAGFVATQAGHFGAVGAPACWMLLALEVSPVAALAIVVIVYAALELAQTQFGPQTFEDAATDTGFVLAGAAFLIGAQTGNTALAGLSLIVAVAAILIGVVERILE